MSFTRDWVVSSLNAKIARANIKGKALTVPRKVAARAVALLGTAPGPEVVKLRVDIFEVLRRHDVSEQCFAEVAALTHAAVTQAFKADADPT